MVDIKHILKNHAYQNIPLNYEEAYALGVMAVNACKKQKSSLDAIQSVACLCALHTSATYRWKNNGKNSHEHYLPENAAEQIAGVCTAVFDEDIKKSEFGFLSPDAPYVIDNCGMGGDMVVTGNISTVSAFIAASSGIYMCKHGSPANADKGRHGSSDFISHICGIDNYAHKNVVRSCVEDLHFGYTEACDTRYKAIHTHTHNIAQLPHMNDIIGPITSPVDPKLMTKKILGINHLVPTEIVAEAYKILNDKGVTDLKHGLFIRGFIDNGLSDGMDEVSVCSGGTRVTELKDESIRSYYLRAGDFGIADVSLDDVTPVGSKGTYSLDVLRGKATRGQNKIFLANAALLLMLGGYSEDLIECYKKAKEVLLSGQAYEKMVQVRERCPIG